MLDLIKNSDSKTPICKRLFFRAYKSSYIDKKGNLVYKTQFTFLKRKSCKGCDLCSQFDDDIKSCDLEDIVEISLDSIENNQIYEADFVAGYSDWETGCIDDWCWRLRKIENID